MTTARMELVSLADTPFYHCISRCVRRAFLCGHDALTGRDLSHRREWITRRMRLLSKVFTIDVCAFAIMGNHYHLVLHVDSRRAERLSPREVALRWQRLFGGDTAVQRFIKGTALDIAEQRRVDSTIAAWRTRLVSLSWYMRALNEYIARRANAEDGCKGRFWEGRFKSQALLDDQSLLSCMVYVDLNPVRARMASTPEASAFTSISERLRTLRLRIQSRRRRLGKAQTDRATCPLMPFAGDNKSDKAIPFNGDEYLSLVDWSGRAVRPDKAGAIPGDLPPILCRLGIKAPAFARHMSGGGGQFARAMGAAERLQVFAERCGSRFIKGMKAARSLFSVPSAQ